MSQNSSKEIKLSNRPCLKVLYTNADQFVNKRNDLEMMISHDKPDLILITEVIPKSQKNPIVASLLDVGGYIPHFSFLPEDDNLGSKGFRGVAIYHRDHLDVVKVEFEDFTDHVWIEVQTVTGPLLVGCVYRSPSDDINMESSMKSSKRVSGLLDAACLRNDSVVIVGDFNYKDIDWTNEYAHPDQRHLIHFLNKLKDNFLYQNVTEPTRYRKDNIPSILDLVLSSEEGMIQNLQYMPPLGESDHLCLRFDVMYSHDAKSVPNFHEYDIRKTKYEKVRNEIKNCNWTDLFNTNFEGNYNIFLDKIFEVVYKHSPKKTLPKTKRNLYMTNEALRVKNKKQKLWKNYLASQNEQDRRKYISSKNNLRMLTRTLRRQFESNLAGQVKKNPKQFWSYAKSRLKTRQKIPALKRSDGSMAVTPKEKADLLNEYFSSVFTVENVVNVPVPNRQDVNESLSSIEITPELVLSKLESLNPNKTCGYDKCHPHMLRELASEICIPLSMLFNQSMKEGAHETWLKGVISPIFKKGKRCDPGNYRPVSITAVLSKVMESLIRDALVSHMMKHNLFADQQHGFVPLRDCITQLLLCLEDWTGLIESGEPFDIIYTDFSKAFDSVPHKRLMVKLESYGIRGDILNWIESFLSGRTQCVAVEGIHSTWKKVLSGIPQGSVLGPILFVIFINDLPDEVKFNHCKMFADDCKLYGTVNQTNLMQSDLNSLANWSEKWQLPFNTSKCKVMHVGISNKKKTYELNSQELQVINSEKDLGVHVDDELKFHVHTAAATKKANQTVGVIKRTYESRDPVTITTLYKAMVRPLLEYGNVIWGPFYTGDIRAVEAIQHRVTKLIPELKDLTYEERIKSLKLPSLRYRRRRGDMITMYKLTKGLIRMDQEELFSPPMTLFTRGHHQRVYKETAMTRARRTTFSYRAVDDWNSLPIDVINAPSLNTFKNKLDDWWRDIHYKED